MADKFRLAGLLRFRKLQEDQAAGELGRANAQAQRARDTARRAAEALGQHTTPDSVNVTAWQAGIASRAALRTEVDVANALVATAQREVDERDALWRAAHARSVPLEKLEERHEEAAAQAELAADQLVIDEAAGRARPAQDVDSPEDGR